MTNEPEQDFVLVDPAQILKKRKRQMPIPKEEWDKHKLVILAMVADRSRTYKEVITFLREKKYFVVTISQLEARLKSWKQSKNLCISQEEEKFINTTLKARQGKETAFRRKSTGEILPQYKVRRTTKRRNPEPSQVTSDNNFGQQILATRAQTDTINIRSSDLVAFTPEPEIVDLDLDPDSSGAPDTRATYRLNHELAAFLLGAEDTKVLIDILLEVPDLAQFCTELSSTAKEMEEVEPWKMDLADLLWKNKWHIRPAELPVLKYTRSILHYVDLPSVVWLMNLGASLDVCITKHSFDDAVKDNNLVIMEMLLKHGNAVEYGLENLAKTFGTACSLGNEVIIRLLLDAGADVNTRNVLGHSPTMLIRASESGRVAVVKILLTAHADVNEKDTMGKTALTRMIKYRGKSGITQNNLEAVLELLLDAKIDLNTPDHLGLTALMLACERGMETVSKRLIEAHADVNNQDRLGRTALMLACRNGMEEVSKLLIDARADVHVLDMWGNTALSIAIKGSHQEIAKHLRFEPVKKNYELVDVYMELTKVGLLW